MITSTTAYAIDKTIVDKVFYVIKNFTFSENTTASRSFTATNYFDNNECVKENCVRRLFSPNFRRILKPPIKARLNAPKSSDRCEIHQRALNQCSPACDSTIDPLIPCLLGQCSMNKYISCLRRKPTAETCESDIVVEEDDCEFAFWNLLNAYNVDMSTAFSVANIGYSAGTLGIAINAPTGAKTSEQSKWSAIMRKLLAPMRSDKKSYLAKILAIQMRPPKHIKKLFIIECEFQNPLAELFSCDGELWSVAELDPFARREKIVAKVASFVEDTHAMTLFWCWQVSTGVRSVAYAKTMLATHRDDMELTNFFTQHIPLVELPQLFIGAKQEYAAIRTWYFRLNGVVITSKGLRHLSACLKPELAQTDVVSAHFIGRRVNDVDSGSSCVNRIFIEYITLTHVSLETTCRSDRGGLDFKLTICRYILMLSSGERKELVVATTRDHDSTLVVKLNGVPYKERESLGAAAASFDATELELVHDKAKLTFKFE